MPDESLENLIQDLQDGFEITRKEAAHRLGKRGDAAAIPALLNALHDSNKLVRDNAAFALAEIGDTRVVPDLSIASTTLMSRTSCSESTAAGASGVACFLVWARFERR